MADNYLEKKFEEHLQTTARPAQKHTPKHTGHVVVIGDVTEWTATAVRSMRVAGNVVTLISDDEAGRAIATSNGGNFEKTVDMSFLTVTDKLKEAGERHGKVEVIVTVGKPEVTEACVFHFKTHKVEGRTARIVVCSEGKVEIAGEVEDAAIYGIEMREETQKQAVGRMVRFLTEGEVVVRSGETVRL